MALNACLPEGKQRHLTVELDQNGKPLKIESFYLENKTNKVLDGGAVYFSWPSETIKIHVYKNGKFIGGDFSTVSPIISTTNTVLFY
jgi:hypothetical protein